MSSCPRQAHETGATQSGICPSPTTTTMLYFGEPLFQHTPAYCDNSLTADCPMCGFGLTEERAIEICEALYGYAKQCIDRTTKPKRFDFAKLIAGPPDLDLLSPTEVFFAGFVTARIHHDSLKAVKKAAARLHEKIEAELTEKLKGQGYTVITPNNIADAPQEVRDIIDILTGKKKPTDDGPEDAG